MKEKITIGPFHPELEESVYFKLTADENRIITNVEIVNGFIHRGMESLITEKNFMQNLILTERVCSLCSNNHTFAYALAVEKISGVKVPPRAEALRVIADEIKRVASDLFNLAMLSHLLHHHELMKETMNTREHMQDLKEIIWGKSLQEKYENDPIVRENTINVGVLPYEDALRLGVTGPVARGSGINNDVRSIAPYSMYKELKPKVTLREGGDIHSRAMARFGDITDAIRMVKEVVHNLPSGEVEAPRGELFYYLKTDGSQKPVRMKWKVPTFTNWEALRIMLLGDKVDNVTLILNSIDPCISCTER